MILASFLFWSRLTYCQIESEYDIRNIEGWTVHIRKELSQSQLEKTDQALKLLGNQLQQIKQVVPEDAVKKLKTVHLWFSLKYPGIRPTAEYHPGKQWLKDNHRNPEMAKGVEFTNVSIFELETRRMPNFALHELAHAYHDQFLPQGHNNIEISQRFQAAKASKKYDNVARKDAHGNITHEKAYAMTNPAEYFAETTEAFFAQNDFYPFNKAELIETDPAMAECLTKIWNVVKEPK